MTDPRDIYQSQMEAEIEAGWQNGKSNMLAVLPTGGGKSVIVSRIAYKKNLLGAKQAIIAHRNELVSQLSMHIAERGIKHRIIGPKQTVAAIISKHRAAFNGYSFVNPTANASVAGIDTLISRKDDLADWAKQQDYWTIDEAHHVLRENKWGTGVEMFPNALGLGVTASPRRGDRKGLGAHHDGVFHAMVLGPDQRTLIDMGALSDYEIAIPETDFEIDEEDVSESGDFSPKKMRAASDKSRLVGDVVTEYIKRAFGKRAICFAIDVKDATDIANRFNAFGIPAAAVSAKTPSTVRDDMVQRFKDGRIWALVNVDLFGEGFDVPACEIVIMARPTASLAVYLQQFGRALRILPGKEFGLIVDHVSNWKRHGFPDKPHHWTLDRQDKRAKRERDPEDVPLTACRACSRPYERFYTCCPYCGAVPPLPAPAERTIEMVEGDLVLLDRAKLDEMRKAILLPTPADVANRAAFVAGKAAGAFQADKAIEKIQAQTRLKDAISQWAGIQRYKGRGDRESYRRFYLATGLDVLGALSKDLSRQDYETLAIKVEGWCHDH